MDLQILKGHLSYAGITKCKRRDVYVGIVRLYGICYWDFGLSFSKISDIGNQNAGGRKSKRIPNKSLCLFWYFDVLHCFVFEQHIRNGRNKGDQKICFTGFIQSIYSFCM
nr:hypothetical protein [uncultured Anaerotignum sp.]